MEVNGIDESEFVFVTYFLDPNSPYSCEQWGDVGLEGSPPIIEGGPFPSGLFSDLMGSPGVPMMSIIDRGGRYIQTAGGYSTHSDNTWNLIQGLVLDYYNPCDGPLLGCTDPQSPNFNPEANEDDGTCIEPFEPGGGGPGGYYEPPIYGAPPCDVNTEVQLWDNCYNIQETTNLLLEGIGLTGEIPPEIGNLTNLEILSLQNNDLTGEIPSEIGNLTNLTHLFLNNNQLTGEIPSEIGNLTNLETLYLAQNQLTGSIPSEIGNLINLDILFLQYNFLTEIPSEIGNLTSLRKLYLHHNQLTGEIPGQIGNLTELIFLYLNNNQLTGNIPIGFGNLTNLSRLSLSLNQLEGSISSNITTNLTELSILELAGNQFTGDILYSIEHLTNLTTLSLGSNQFTGGISAQFLANNLNLQNLNLQFNQFSGTIPFNIGNLTNIRYLNLSNNNFSGPIPATFGNPNGIADGIYPTLSSLYLDNNQLEGEIPPQLANLPVLTYDLETEQMITSGLTNFDISGNNLTGEIPQEVCDMLQTLQTWWGGAQPGIQWLENTVLDGNDLINTCDNITFRDEEVEERGGGTGEGPQPLPIKPSKPILGDKYLDELADSFIKMAATVDEIEYHIAQVAYKEGNIKWLMDYNYKKIESKLTNSVTIPVDNSFYKESLKNELERKIILSTVKNPISDEPVTRGGGGSGGGGDGGGDDGGTEDTDPHDHWWDDYIEDNLWQDCGPYVLPCNPGEIRCPDCSCAQAFSTSNPNITSCPCVCDDENQIMCFGSQYQGGFACIPKYDDFGLPSECPDGGCPPNEPHWCPNNAPYNQDECVTHEAFCVVPSNIPSEVFDYINTTFDNFFGGIQTLEDLNNLSSLFEDANESLIQLLLAWILEALQDSNIPGVQWIGEQIQAMTCIGCGKMCIGSCEGLGEFSGSTDCPIAWCLDGLKIQGAGLTPMERECGQRFAQFNLEGDFLGTSLTLRENCIKDRFEQLINNQCLIPKMAGNICPPCSIPDPDNPWCCVVDYEAYEEGGVCYNPTDAELLLEEIEKAMIHRNSWENRNPCVGPLLGVSNLSFPFESTDYINSLRTECRQRGIQYAGGLRSGQVGFEDFCQLYPISEDGVTIDSYVCDLAPYSCTTQYHCNYDKSILNSPGGFIPGSAYEGSGIDDFKTICHNHECVECWQHTDCPDSDLGLTQYCDHDINQHECKEGCGYNSDCPEGHECVNHQCVSEPPPCLLIQDIGECSARTDCVDINLSGGAIPTFALNNIGIENQYSGPGQLNIEFSNLDTFTIDSSNGYDNIRMPIWNPTTNTYDYQDYMEITYISQPPLMFPEWGESHLANNFGSHHLTGFACVDVECADDTSCLDQTIPMFCGYWGQHYYYSDTPDNLDLFEEGYCGSDNPDAPGSIWNMDGSFAGNCLKWQGHGFFKERAVTTKSRTTEEVPLYACEEGGIGQNGVSQNFVGYEIYKYCFFHEPPRGHVQWRQEQINREAADNDLMTAFTYLEPWQPETGEFFQYGPGVSFSGGFDTHRFISPMWIGKQNLCEGIDAEVGGYGGPTGENPNNPCGFGEGWCWCNSHDGVATPYTNPTGGSLPYDDLFQMPPYIDHSDKWGHTADDSCADCPELECNHMNMSNLEPQVEEILFPEPQVNDDILDPNWEDNWQDYIDSDIGCGCPYPGTEVGSINYANYTPGIDCSCQEVNASIPDPTYTPDTSCCVELNYCQDVGGLFPSKFELPLWNSWNYWPYNTCPGECCGDDECEYYLNYIDMLNTYYGIRNPNDAPHACGGSQSCNPGFDNEFGGTEIAKCECVQGEYGTNDYYVYSTGMGCSGRGCSPDNESDFSFCDGCCPELGFEVDCDIVQYPNHGINACKEYCNDMFCPPGYTFAGWGWEAPHGCCLPDNHSFFNR